jgi:hypothetical protein
VLHSALAVMAGVFFCPIVSAETDYIYGLHQTSLANNTWNLAQFAIDNPNDVSPVVSASTVFSDLQSYISGYGSEGRFIEHLNGLAIDASTNTIYFNYTYANTVLGGDVATYSFHLYQMQYQSNAWQVSQVTGFDVLPSGIPNTDSQYGGAFPAAAFYDGYYYARGQYTQDIFRVKVNPDGTASDLTAYPNTYNVSIGTSFYAGGDMLIHNNGADTTLYTSTVQSTEFLNMLLRNDLDDVIAGTGTTTVINFDSEVPFEVHGELQIAGLGEIGRMYGLSSASDNLFQFGNPDAPTAAGLGIRNLADLSSFIGPDGRISDLTAGLTAPVPEPSSAALVALMGVVGLFRRSRC